MPQDRFGVWHGRPLRPIGSVTILFLDVWRHHAGVDQDPGCQSSGCNTRFSNISIHWVGATFLMKGHYRNDPLQNSRNICCFKTIPSPRSPYLELGYLDCIYTVGCPALLSSCFSPHHSVIHFHFLLILYIIVDRFDLKTFFSTTTLSYLTLISFFRQFIADQEALFAHTITHTHILLFRRI